MSYSLGQAAEAAGVSKTTLRRAIKSGRISANKREDGSFEIDGAELARVFPRPTDGSAPPARHGAGNDHGMLRLEADLLREQLEQVKGERDDLRRRLDQSEEERRRLTLMVTDQRSARRRWWPWRR